VVLPSGGEPREFPFPNPTPIGNLRWFGDSRGLGFAGRDARGEPTVFRLTLTTGEWTTFAAPELRSDNNRIEWNADGSRYFHTRQDVSGAGPAIVERDLQSDRERIVFRGDPKQPGQFNSLRFSPDRRMLAINLFLPPNDTTQQRIVVLDIETGQTPAVYNSDVGEGPPLDTVTWAPAGRALLVRVRTSKGILELRRIPIDGGEARRVPLGPEFNRLLLARPSQGAPAPSLEHVTWSPDGSRLAFVLRASRFESFVIENPLAGGASASARK
jgi:Tol biopolymer transport system component